MLGIPVDGGDATVAALKADIRDAKGRTALIETGDWDNSGSAKLTLKTERFGAEPAAAYRLAMRAYGHDDPYNWPSYDVVKLANAI